MNETGKQFSFTRAASSTSGRAPPQIPIIALPLLFVVLLSGAGLRAQSFTPIDLPMPTAAGGMAQWGDYDGDGRYDLMITGQAPGLNVYHNDGGGSFTPQGLSLVLRQSGAVAWGDWDNDNRLDLVVGGADTGGYPVQNVYSLTRFYRNDGTNFTQIGEGIPFIGYPTLVDIDRDGDLDLVIAGDTPNIGAGDSLTIRSIRIYLNQGNGKFDLGAEFPTPDNTYWVTVTDLNSDGYPDLLYCQYRDDSTLVTTLLNCGACQFTSNAVLYAMGPGQLLVGDLDNDGDDDYGMIGYNNGPMPSASGWVRNDNGVGAFLPGVTCQMFNSGYTLVDYNNDGRLDVALVGGLSSSENRFRLLRNQGGFSFSEVNPGIDGTQFAVMAWGDYDGDGDLDLFLSGIPNDAAGTNFIRLYRNNATVSNAPPTTPAGLSAAVSGSGVRLAWLPALDPNQNGGLSYNLRVGRTTGGVDIVTPMANLASGRLLLPQRGNAGLITTMPLTNLLAGSYFWSVQTVDNGFASSVFAAERTFEIPPGLPRAGVSTAWDIRYLHATLGGSAIPNGAAAQAWFEYGLSTNYGATTPATSIGVGTLPVSITNEITGLLTATNYHFRLVVSNSVGLSRGPESVFLITNTLPTLQFPTNLLVIFPNCSSPILNFTVGDLETPPDSLFVTGTALNTLLLPPSSIQLGGSGSNRTLVVTPAAEQRGMTFLSVVVTDEHGGKKSKSVTVRVEDFSPIWVLSAGSGDAVVADVDRDGYLDVVRMDRWFQNLTGTNLAQPSVGAIDSPLGSPALTDIDNDGDIDLLETGSKSTRVWTNGLSLGHPGRFLNASVNGLGGFNSGSATLWTDFDQNGRYDLIMAGYTNWPTANSYVTRAFRNDGSLGFTLLADVLPNLADAALACADFDRDGDMDVCVAGTTNVQPPGYYTGLFSNDGAGHFSPQATGLPMVTKALLLWGDFDNDGWPDLLLSGTTRVGNGFTNITKIFHNDRNGAFSEFATLEPLLLPKGFLTDLDSDGRLDVVLWGNPPSQSYAVITKMYLNKGAGQFVDIGPALVDSSSNTAGVTAGDLTQDGKPDLVLAPYVLRNNFPGTNTPPQPPSGLQAAPTADTVMLSWSAATDVNQSGGLSYNLRVGTHPGVVDIMSPLADPVTGRRWVVGAGNASESLQWHLRGLKPGVYFWSVQAIDHAGAGSAFAPEASFVIADPRPRILSVTSGNGAVDLQVDFGAAGSFSVMLSPDLITWTELAPVNYGVGTTNLSVPWSTGQARYFRLRKSP
jgi:hypothetical protein